MHPLTNDMKQRFIVQYLAPLGEYQEVCVITSNLVIEYCSVSIYHGRQSELSVAKYFLFLYKCDVTSSFFQLLTYMFEHNALEQIFHHIDLTKNRDVRLAFETLKVNCLDIKSALQNDVKGFE